MATKSDRKAAFLRAHPFCCFCGGKAPSAERDHIPGRALFDGRHWPAGFEFPACVRCNRASRDAEQVVALLSRLLPSSHSPQLDLEFQERLRAVGYNFPALLAEMRPTIRQVRAAAKKYGFAPGPGQSHLDLPLLSVRGPLVNAAIENFARKLFCALYYKHALSILPPGGGIAVKWYSNLQIGNEAIPRQLATVLTGLPNVQRASKKLDDQFYYRWAVGESKSMAGFLAFFRQSFAIVGFVNADGTDFGLPANARIVRPYDWPLNDAI